MIKNGQDAENFIMLPICQTKKIMLKIGKNVFFHKANQMNNRS